MVKTITETILALESLDWGRGRVGLPITRIPFVNFPNFRLPNQ